MNRFEKGIVRGAKLPTSTLIGGVDEVGRGAWAGPIVVAGVILPHDYVNLHIRDSKQLSAAQRKRLFEEIMRDALNIEVLFIPTHLIDNYGPKQTTVGGMARIVANWSRSHQADLVLTDAELIDSDLPTIALVRGDERSQTIAAASIIAKVIRDRHMQLLDICWPRFGFGTNKGYGTKHHHTMLRRYGSCWLHRQSYKPVRAVNQLRLNL